MFVLVTAMVFVMFSVSKCQVQLHGKCPNLPVVKKLNIYRYQGKWFEIERFPFFIARGQKCTQTFYSRPYCNYRDCTVYVDTIRQNITTDGLISSRGTGTIIDNTYAKWFVDFGRPPRGEYWVLKTNYRDYSLVWSCVNNDDGTSSTAFAWIISRKRTLCSETVEMLKICLKNNGIDPSPFQKTDQTGCVLDI